ncbi:hypothetical protein PAEPH01_2355 [Pancytospora epiphaga]|nr:hypothetical protein PAEPH01_2355 [Pancytospora epiphaga]
MGMRYLQDKAWCWYLRICSMFGKKTIICSHCKKRSKTIVTFATQCNKMLYHDYIRRPNKAVSCINLGLCLKYIIYMYHLTCVHILFKR